MVSLGEGYRALGAGMASQYQRDRDEMKKLMRLQQRQQLMTAALAPIAQGIGKAATDLISAPFKDAADNFYRRGAGRGLNAKIATFKANRAEALSRYSEIQKQGHRNYYSGLGDEALKLYEAEMASQGFDKDSAYYSEGLAALQESVRKEQDREWAEVKKEAQYYLSHPTAPKDIDTALAKYSPYAKNPMDWLYKTAKRVVTGTKREDYEQAALDKLSTHLGLDDATIAQVKELNKTASDYFFSPEVIKSNPLFQSEDFLRDSQQFKENQAFRSYILSKGNGGQQTLYATLEKDSKRLPSEEAFEYAVNEAFSQAVSPSALKDSQTAFRQSLSLNVLPEVIKEQLTGMTQAQQTAEMNNIANGVFSTARKIVQDQYLSRSSTADLSNLDSIKFIADVEEKAIALLNTANLDVLRDPLVGSPEGRIVISTALNEAIRDNPSVTRLSNSSGPVASSIPVNVDFRDDENESILTVMRDTIENLLESDMPNDQRRAEFERVEQDAIMGIKKAQGIPDGAKLNLIYPKALQEQIESLEEDSLNLGYLGPAARALRSMEVSLSDLPTPYSISEGVAKAGSDFRAYMQQEAQRQREEKLKGPSDVELQRRQAYEDRAASETFGDTEMSREMPPLGRARAAYRSNLREPFQNIQSLLARDEQSPPSDSVLAAREAAASNRREPFQNVDALLNSGNIQDVTRNALSYLGIRAEPKSPERVAEIMQQRAEAIKAYEAGKPLSTEEPAIIDSIIDFFIPGAEASPIIEQEFSRDVTQIGAIASRQEQREIDRWEGKKTMDVSGVVRGGKKMTISTEDPVAFIRNSDLTPTESIALYYTALKQHSDERPSARPYAMKPLTQAMLWTYEAMPEEVSNLERVFATRIQSQEMSENIQAIVDSSASQSEISTYAAKVSKMSKSQKEAEFKRQSRIARKVPTETDEDFARNAIEYLKLQSIFGEDSDRTLSSGGRSGKVTVNDKVDEYYTNMLQFTMPAYDKQTQLYADLLMQLRDAPRIPSLLAQN